MSSSSYNKGDFPAACCPLKPNPLETLGVDAFDEPDNIASKYLMYPVAGADDLLLRKYPISESIIALRHNAEFLALCRGILVELHKRLRTHIDVSCRLKNLVYEEIALCVPLNWDSSFLNEYLNIIKEVYPEICANGMDNVHFISESDALAHYMLQHCIGEGRLDEEWDLILFLDFGGHTMVGISQIFCTRTLTKPLPSALQLIPD